MKLINNITFGKFKNKLIWKSRAWVDG